MEEIWIDIKGFDGYLISNKGNVKSKDRVIIRRDGIPRTCKGLIKKAKLNPNGYLFVGLSINHKNHNKYLHRLVAEHFISNPQNLPCVNHIDGNKLNNNVENLEWCSYSQNSKHSYDILKQNRPSARGISFKVKVINITTDDIIYFNSVSKASRELGISKSQILRILDTDKATKSGYKFIRIV